MPETATSEVEWTTTWSGVGETDFRELMSSFPSGVTVVTTQDAEGIPYGLTCTSIAINLLHAGGQRAAEVFASAVRDRFAAVHWDRTPRRVVVFGQGDGFLTRPRNPLLYGLRSYPAWTGA